MSLIEHSIFRNLLRTLAVSTYYRINLLPNTSSIDPKISKDPGGKRLRSDKQTFQQNGYQKSKNS